MKKVDKIAVSAVACAHLLNTGMYGTAPVRLAVSFCPAPKGVLGWTGNTLNTCRSLTYAVFNIPALVLNSFEQEYVMYKQNVVDVVNDCAYTIEFLSQAVAPPPNDRTQDFSRRAQEGLSLILSYVSDRLEAASNAMQSHQTEMEICP